MSQSEHPTDPLPDARVQWVLAEPPQPKKKRIVWPWFVGAAVALLVLLGAAVLIAESLLRSSVERGIADQVRAELQLPADHPVGVTIAGVFLPQLIAGQLDEITITSEDVPLGPATADVDVVVREVSTSAPYTMAGGEASVSVSQEQVTALLEVFAPISVAEVMLEEPAIVVGTELSLFGIGIPVSVSLVPGAEDGQLSLRADELRVSGIAVSADQIRSQFGGIADPLVQDWPLCVAQFLPAGATLTGAAVEGQTLVATFDIDGGILSDAALQETGSCA